MKDTILERDGFRRNNFNALRLFLAAAVIWSHTYPAISDEMEKREIIYHLTDGLMDLGALAVNAFFAISGYLISLSWLRTPKVPTYLAKRVLRIHPGFILASLVSLLVVAPLAGSDYNTIFSPVELFKSFARMCALSAPRAIGAFEGEPIPVLNLPLWTIRYEFLCYLIVPVIFWKGAGLGRKGILALYLLVLAGYVTQSIIYPRYNWPNYMIIGSMGIWPRFLTYFLGGAALALNSDAVPFRHWLFLLCVAILLITLLFTGGFFIAAATAGIYVIFYLAYQRTVPLHWVGEGWDFSYGTYLYGWPVQMLIIQRYRDTLGPWQLFGVSLPFALVMAMLSWYLVEARFLRMKKRVEPGSSQGRPHTD